MDYKLNKSSASLDEGSEAALALVRAIILGDSSAKAAAYKRLQSVWTQTEIDNLSIDMESLLRSYAG